MKNGVSLLVLVLAVTIMIILISSVSVVGSRAISSANFDEYISVISRVSDDVNEYYIANNVLPITNEVISKESLGQEFLNNLKKNNDLANQLFVIDIGKLNDLTIKKGRGTIKSKDVFVVSENTHNIYYLKGFKYKQGVYYTN